MFHCPPAIVGGDSPLRPVTRITSYIAVRRCALGVFQEVTNVMDPQLFLKDAQLRQRQRQDVAAGDRLASERFHPMHDLMAQTGAALVRLGSRMRTWGGVSEEPAIENKWEAKPAANTRPATTNAASSKQRPCPEPVTLKWEKTEGAYWVTVGSHEPSK